MRASTSARRAVQCAQERVPLGPAVIRSATGPAGRMHRGGPPTVASSPAAATVAPLALARGAPARVRRHVASGSLPARAAARRRCHNNSGANRDSGDHRRARPGRAVSDHHMGGLRAEDEHGVVERWMMMARCGGGWRGPRESHVVPTAGSLRDNGVRQWSLKRLSLVAFQWSSTSLQGLGQCVSTQS